LIRSEQYKRFKNAQFIKRLEEDWLTPVDYLPYIDALFGDIDLDPCTTELANGQFLRARNFYTKEDDGLNIETPWTGKVYLFPPTYGRCSWSAPRGTWKWGLRGGSSGTSPTAAWFKRLVREWKLGNVSEGLLFSTNHECFRTMPEMWNYPVCIPKDRANLIHGDRLFTFQTPLTWGYFVYLPPRELGFDPSRRFREIFSHVGHIVG
jgi:hypothetical protein